MDKPSCTYLHDSDKYLNNVFTDGRLFQFLRRRHTDVLKYAVILKALLGLLYMMYSVAVSIV